MVLMLVLLPWLLFGWLMKLRCDYDFAHNAVSL